MLATAVVTDGRKERSCRFCSETKGWSGAKCRRCQTDVPTGCMETCAGNASAHLKKWAQLVGFVILG